MGISLRRFHGWEPEERIVPDGDGYRVVREPEWDQEQYQLRVALYEHEASLNELGIPIDEAMSPLADPGNPDRTHEYVTVPKRDWSLQAKYEGENDPKWKGDNYTPARKWQVIRVDRQSSSSRWAVTSSPAEAQAASTRLNRSLSANAS